MSMKSLLFVVAATAALSAQAQDCEPRWADTFCGAGTDDPVRSACVFDDGTGPALYAAGEFSTAGGLPCEGISKWDGRKWLPLGTPAGHRRGLPVVYDDGTGPKLYAFDVFTQPTYSVALTRWDGTAWTQVSLLGSRDNIALSTACVFDDGTGPAIYIGGHFDQIAGVTAPYLARWKGGAWGPVGGVFNGAAYTLAVHDDGGGPALYAGGFFTDIGGVPAQKIAKWNGSAWSGVGAGWSWSVTDLISWYNGSQQVLCGVGEQFIPTGATFAVATWDGASWNSLPPLYAGGMTNLAVFNDGGGEKLIVGGEGRLIGPPTTCYGVAAWDGTQWSPLKIGIDSLGSVSKMVAADLGGGPGLFVMGWFQYADGLTANNIARWNGAAWSVLGGGLDRVVRQVATFDFGDGEQVVAAGDFFTAGPGPAPTGYARWNGSSWVDLNPPFSRPGTFGQMLSYDLGSGRQFFICGDIYPTIGSWGVISWIPGIGWSGLAEGLNAAGHCMAAYDDGTGPAVYVGGRFTKAGLVWTVGIARWNGATWSALADGLDNTVNSVAVFDDGTGPALYACGLFRFSGSTPLGGIAKWDGAQWSDIGTGLPNYTVKVLRAIDDGSGPALYAAGNFTTIGGVSASRLARWNGVAWSTVGPPLPHPFATVNDIVVADEGAGPRLYVALSNGDDGLVRLDPTGWTEMLHTNSSVLSITKIVDAASGENYIFGAGGSFTRVADVGSQNIACLIGCPVPVSTCLADLNGDGLVDFSDYLEFLNLYDAQDLRADFNQDGLVDFSDYLEFLNHYDAGC